MLAVEYLLGICRMDIYLKKRYFMAFEIYDLLVHRKSLAVRIHRKLLV